MHASNAYFTQIGNVPARWNRMVPSTMASLLHSGSIDAPEKLTDDPRSGRLTFTASFICRRNAA